MVSAEQYQHDRKRNKRTSSKRVEDLGTAYLYKQADGRTVLLDEKKLTVLRRASHHVAMKRYYVHNLTVFDRNAVSLVGVATAPTHALANQIAEALNAQDRTMAQPRHVDIVFDGPPGPVAGRFVEVEDHAGKSAALGTWLQRDDGYWVLRFQELR